MQHPMNMHKKVTKDGFRTTREVASESGMVTMNMCSIGWMMAQMLKHMGTLFQEV